MEQLEVGGHRIAFRRAGSGPALILLHRFYGDSRVWRKQLEALSDEFTVVAWDGPGCGESSDPTESYRISEYAECRSSFIGALGLDQPPVLGLSLGCPLA